MKKSRDSRDVFAVFKADSFMKDATFGEKLKYWFKNVYWYHFRIATFAVIFVAVLAGVFISDVFFRKYNDLDFILAGTVFAESRQMQEMSDKLSDFIEADDEDGPKVGWQMLCTQSVAGTGDSALVLDEGASANIDKITVTMADDEILLFFFDKKYIEWYAKDGAFEPLSTFGIESDNEYFVRVDETEFFKQFDIIHSGGIYAGIKVRTEGRIKNERIAAKYENAARALASLLAYTGKEG